ncbi:MAG: DUF3313 domain-containing protein [Sphingomicrobium sp.]
MTAKAWILCQLTVPAFFMVNAVPAAAQTKDHAPAALSSSNRMTQDKPGTESWTYAQPASVFTKYRTVIVDPTTVYQGPDAQFDGVDPADRQKYAVIISDELRSEIAKSFPTPARPQADTLRLRVTILGATKTKGGIATATRVTPMGFGISALKSALGKTGTFTGSLLYAVELHDARTNELLLAAVRRRTPDPLDVPATLSQTETVKAVAREFADGARKRLESLTGVGPSR